MKSYNAPEIRISEFERSGILTISEKPAAATAVQQAMAEADKIDGSVGAFIVDIG